MSRAGPRRGAGPTAGLLGLLWVRDKVGCGLEGLIRRGFRYLDPGRKSLVTCSPGWTGGLASAHAHSHRLPPANVPGCMGVRASLVSSPHGTESGRCRSSACEYGWPRVPPQGPDTPVMVLLGEHYGNPRPQTAHGPLATQEATVQCLLKEKLQGVLGSL